ncbi:phosphate signaling complex PhoU family protein [Ornithinibacillus halophilus]|uniref:Phosphate uptake regulator, PhoU n=1 Tax=Ornithinibacillus halophilus TaxID=930117 RepID=A0A1M5P0E2_9BACI|nr:phosphate uptake regulator PhoU [Ornithinibacillus halophilus]SHG94673.1 phosphate uptake regulator, PhoU [Ornithinibacillus halophilus]
MLVRQNYYQEKRIEIKDLIISILDNLDEMTDYYTTYLNNPSDDNREQILEAENFVDKNERKIEKYISEIISLQQLTINEVKWLLAMNRIIRDLERIGDQLTNIITISDATDTVDLKPMIRKFFSYEKEMMDWLIKGINEDDIQSLDKVIHHDKYVNKLNKDTYQKLVTLINEHEKISESKLKTVIISRFLERIGDHLVNIAKTYKNIVLKMHK